MATAAALPANALQARVQKLLSSRAEIESTKALLHTLVVSDASAARASGSSPAAPIVAIDVTSSLADLRKNLRTSLEEKQFALAESVLQGLGSTLAKISLLKDNVESLDAKCTQIQQFLETTKRETQQVQAEAALLSEKKERMQHELEEIREFLGRYQLTEQETQGLHTKSLSDDHVHGFLGIMERVQQVKADCRALVAAGDVNCALELLDAVGKYQELGFERLYQWTSKKCSEMDGEPSNQLHRAIALLRERVEFYNYCKECVTASRRSVIVRRFIVALTRGGPNGIPRPIEMHAHDPVRYCGDMLAWVHQAIATENEFFRVLFDGDLEYIPEVNQESEGEEGKLFAPTSTPAAASMVGKAFEGVARPLQVRIEQTLSSPHGIVIAYKLVLLLAFYHHKFGTLVRHSGIAKALEHCRDASNHAFHQQLRQLVDTVASSAQDYSTNLSATHATMDASQRLTALLEVFQTSLLPDNEKEDDLTPLFDGILPAVAQMCARSIEGLDAIDALVFQINNLSCIQVPLAKFPEAAKWHQSIGADISRWLRELSELETKSVLERCNASSLLHSIQHFQTSETTTTAASDAPGLDGATISSVMDLFCNVLQTLIFPQLDQIAQPDLRDSARSLTVTQLAATYAFIYDFVSDPKHGYTPSRRASGAPTSRNVVVLAHTPQEVRTVLEID
uniref:Conserved oligomeric Golgi complex subunit 6 n=1 Tax=Globisporangium ultimum (strain ATCC 200006 / CBS 805.95 / DAOM BR144) TaxID=431595 RepID=K3X0D2_GLOUD